MVNAEPCKIALFQSWNSNGKINHKTFIFQLRQIAEFIYLKIVQQFSVCLEMSFMLLLNLVKVWHIGKHPSSCVIYIHIVNCPWRLVKMLVLRGYWKALHEAWIIFTWGWYCTLFIKWVIQVSSILCVIVKATYMILHLHVTNNTSFAEHEYLYGQSFLQCVVVLWHKIKKKYLRYFFLLLSDAPKMTWIFMGMIIYLLW